MSRNGIIVLTHTMLNMVPKKELNLPFGISNLSSLINHPTRAKNYIFSVK